MHPLRNGYRALVLGASGGLGQAFEAVLAADPRCAEVLGLARSGTVRCTGPHAATGLPLSTPPWDLRNEASLTTLAQHLNGPFHLVVDATGALTLDGRGPEKRLGELDAAALTASIEVNAVGPLLLLRYLSPLLARGERVVWAKLSARVGSIEDNRKGGWYGYRMAKAALNQGLQTAAIELARQRPQLVVAALQPGTVRTALSQPFVGDTGTDPILAAQRLLAVLDTLVPQGRAHFVDHSGAVIPW